MRKPTIPILYELQKMFLRIFFFQWDSDIGCQEYVKMVTNNIHLITYKQILNLVTQTLNVATQTYKQTLNIVTLKQIEVINSIEVSFI